MTTVWYSQKEKIKHKKYPVMERAAEQLFGLLGLGPVVRQAGDETGRAARFAHLPVLLLLRLARVGGRVDAVLPCGSAGFRPVPFRFLYCFGRRCDEMLLPRRRGVVHPSAMSRITTGS